MRRGKFFGTVTAYGLSLAAVGALADEPIELAVAPPTGPDAAGLYYGLQQGWFQQAGLKVTVVVANGAAAVPGVIGGSLQIAYANTLSLCQAHAKGIPITLIAPGVAYRSTGAFNELIVGADSTVRSAKDLVGKTIAVSELGDMESFAIQVWLGQAGVDPAAVHFVEIKPSSMLAALDAKRVDAIGIYEPFLSAAKDKGARVLAKPFDVIGPYFLEEAWFTMMPYATAHRSAILQFAAVVNRGAQYHDTHYDELVPMVSDFSKIPASALQHMTHGDVPTALASAMIQPVIDSAAKYHAIANSFPAKDFIFS